MATLDEQRVATLNRLRDEQNNAADSEKRVWGNFVAAQEALVQQAREARLSLGLAESSASSIETLIKASLDGSKEKITQAVDALDTATKAVEEKQKQIAAQKSGVDAAEAEIKRLLGTLDERKKELKDALDRVTKLQTDALAAARSTTPDAARKAWALIAELNKAKAKLSDLLSGAQKLEKPVPAVNEQNLTAYIKAANANAELPNYGKALIIAQHVPEDTLAEYLKHLLAAQKKARVTFDTDTKAVGELEKARKRADEDRQAVVK